MLSIFPSGPGAGERNALWLYIFKFKSRGLLCTPRIRVQKTWILPGIRSTVQTHKFSGSVCTCPAISSSSSSSSSCMIVHLFGFILRSYFQESKHTRLFLIHEDIQVKSALFMYEPCGLAYIPSSSVTG